ncbi:MAG: c-type cytochrome [Gammaproteobacteria bacterium]|nr:c-type cytochrome [Gammaproteobacteria bacterium]
MKCTCLLLVSTLLFVACVHDPADGRSDGDTAAGTTASGINGEAAYNENCAGCHETGMLGAPIAGDAADWGGRSQLWDAVLLDHAITGYFEMPAKGGRADLPDDVVRAAAEYMLRMSFPDMQHDCNPPLCAKLE